MQRDSIIDTLITSTPTGPDINQILLMVSAFIIVVVILVWRKYAPIRLRSKLVFDSAVKKTWILLSSEAQRVAFTRLILEAVKSDGKITGDEAEAIYEEMDMDYKKKAADISLDDMYSTLSSCNVEVKENINLALAEVLISDGDFDPMEKTWLDEVKTKLG